MLARLPTATAEDLLRFTTDRDLGRATGVSAGSVRRHFAREPGSERLDRGRLFVAVVERVVDEMDAAHRANAARWAQAAAELRDGGGPDALVRAVAEDLTQATADGDPLRRAHDRAMLLALVVADGDDPASREAADLLRGLFDRYDAQYGRAYEAILAATGRRLAADVALADVQQVTYALLDHYASRRRLGADTPAEIVLAHLMRVWMSFTRRVDEPGPDSDPLQELLRGL